MHPPERVRVWRAPADLKEERSPRQSRPHLSSRWVGTDCPRGENPGAAAERPGLADSEFRIALSAGPSMKTDRGGTLQETAGGRAGAEDASAPAGRSNTAKGPKNPRSAAGFAVDESSRAAKGAQVEEDRPGRRKWRSPSCAPEASVKVKQIDGRSGTGAGGKPQGRDASDHRHPNPQAAVEAPTPKRDRLVAGCHRQRIAAGVC